MRPLGSRSCGPEPEPKYDFYPHKFSFAFALRACGFDEATELSRLDFGVKTAALSDAYIYVKPKKIIQVADCEIYFRKAIDNKVLICYNISI